MSELRAGFVWLLPDMGAGTDDPDAAARRQRRKIDLELYRPLMGVGEGEVLLGPKFEGRLQMAHQGDARAWGMLYGQTASIVEAGLPVPAPLAIEIAGRLRAISSALQAPPSAGGVQKALYAAVAPHPRGMRKVGKRGALTQAPPPGDIGPDRPLSPAEKAADAAADMLAVDNRRGRRKRVLALTAEAAGVDPASVDRELKRRHPQRTRDT